ncbi:MAG TPA: lysine--tRNA ligase [Candidatus Paceibacterota bacterium]
MSENDLRTERLKKLEILKERGIDPYPNTIPHTSTIAHFLETFAEREQSGLQEHVSLAGRIMSLREHGGIMFADLFDGVRIQLVLRLEDLGDEVYNLFKETVDQGDFISATGTAFTTKRGERSLKVSSWTMASKSLLPLPSEWFGIKDEETRFRQRYLDIILDSATRDVIERRSAFWRTVRDFLLARNFLEVETPVLETEPGGADARPFVTHHNALNIDVYLRISAGELWQKRLLVAGFEKVFEIGRIFRNEGMSHEHLQDYTQLEFYQAYSNMEEGMALVRDLYRTIAEKVYGTMQFTYRDHTVNLEGEWPTIDFCEQIKMHFGIDPLTCTDKEAVDAAEKAGIPLDAAAQNTPRIVDLMWKQIRKTISGPAFLVGVPVYLEPLAKRSPNNPKTVERFQVILGGSEIGKGFSELNDPLDQEKRFEHQQALREAGDEEAQRMDRDYVEALEYGMPPAFGFGVSERLFSFFENKSVRETQVFPLMRPKGE